MHDVFLCYLSFQYYLYWLGIPLVIGSVHLHPHVANVLNHRYLKILIILYKLKHKYQSSIYYFEYSSYQNAFGSLSYKLKVYVSIQGCIFVTLVKHHLHIFQWFNVLFFIHLLLGHRKHSVFLKNKLVVPIELIDTQHHTQAYFLSDRIYCDLLI